MRKLFHQNKIQDVIKEGQILLVQVVKRRTRQQRRRFNDLSFTGRTLLRADAQPDQKRRCFAQNHPTFPTVNGLNRLSKELPVSSDMSLIVRTAGEEKTKSDIVRDYNYLIRTWEQIRLDALKSAAPALVL